MILLPLLFLWARTPMYFSRSLMSCLIPTATLIALVVPLFECCNSSIAAEKNRVNYLREGTLTPKMSGKIVAMGRQWVFVADEPSETPPVNDSPSNRLRTTVTRTETLTSDAVRLETTSTIESNFTHRLAERGPNDLSSEPSNRLLVENLALQRIVTAIKSDPNDNHWTITARATEFFDENRLIILTAQRANE